MNDTKAMRVTLQFDKDLLSQHVSLCSDQDLVSQHHVKRPHLSQEKPRALFKEVLPSTAFVNDAEAAFEEELRACLDFWSLHRGKRHRLSLPRVKRRRLSQGISVDEEVLASVALMNKAKAAFKEEHQAHIDLWSWPHFERPHLSTCFGQDLCSQHHVKIPHLSQGFIMAEEGPASMESRIMFSDVKGVEEAKAELEEIVQYFQDCSRFIRIGARLPKGVLLFGSPGSGKTMLARAIAGEARVPLIMRRGDELEENGEQGVSNLFSAAKEQSPCIIFIDEIEKMHTRIPLNQLLVELDGIKQNGGIIVIAATNFPSSLDKALLRRGRFDRRVFVANPDVEGRRQILEYLVSKILKADDLDLMRIAEGTPGFSGGDLAKLVNDAAVRAGCDGAEAVSMDYLEYAKDKIIMGSVRKLAFISDECRKKSAYHEAGHALVAFHTDGALAVDKATIVPRGMAVGMVSYLPERDQTTKSRKQLLAEIDVAMGGRAAEELIFGEMEVTSGASSDFENATYSAKLMITKYGMSKEIGFVTYSNYDDNEGSMSNETRRRIEEVVNQFLERAYNNAKTILITHNKELHALANALLERETITGSQIKDLLCHLLQHQPQIVEEGSSQSKLVPLSPNPAASAPAAAAAATAAAKAKGAAWVGS